MLDGGGLLFELPFRGREKEKEFVKDEGLGPFVDVSRVADDVEPDAVFCICKTRSRRLGAMAKSGDAVGEDVVEREAE